MKAAGETPAAFVLIEAVEFHKNWDIDTQMTDDPRLVHLRGLSHPDRTMLMLSVVAALSRRGREEFFEALRKMMPDATSGEMIREMVLSMMHTMSMDHAAAEVPMFRYFSDLMADWLHASIDGVPRQTSNEFQQHVRELMVELHGDSIDPSHN